jgi:hypothetical protein
MLKTIMLFSGGADSAFIAYKILSETDDELTALVLVNEPEGSITWAHKETHIFKLNSLVDELKKIRNFQVIIKQVSKKEIHPENNHVYLYGIEYVAPYINDGTYDRFVTGRTWEQQNQSLFKGSLIKGTPTYFASKNLWDKLTKRGTLWDPLVDGTFYKEFNRWHILKYLPNSIRDRTVSCHYPKFNEEHSDVVACGVCYKCLWEEKVQEFFDKGYTSEQITAWRRLKSLEYGGGNNISSPMRYWLPVEMKKGTILNYVYDDGTKIKLDSKEIIQKINQTKEHYTYRNRPKTGIWDFSKYLEENG